MKLFICALVAMLPGCALLTPLQPSYAELTAAQSKAQQGDKSINANCLNIRGAGYSLDQATISFDQNVIKDGGGFIVDSTKGCAITSNTLAPVPKVPHVVDPTPGAPPK